MQTSASLLNDDFPQLLARLPAGLDLDRLAAEHGALSRRREITDAAALLRLALARGPGGLSLRETAAWAGLIGLARLSNPAVKYRLDQRGTSSKPWRGSCWPPARNSPLRAGRGGSRASPMAPA